MQTNLKKKENKVLLDTSALIALLKKETGYEKVEHVLANSAISSVNLCEFVSILAKNNIPDHEIDDITQDIIPEIITFSEEIANIAGKLCRFTKDFGLSLGDRACIATGVCFDLTVYTADKIWCDLDIPDLKLVLIR